MTRMYIAYLWDRHHEDPNRQHLKQDATCEDIEDASNETMALVTCTGPEVEILSVQLLPPTLIGDNADVCSYWRIALYVKGLVY